MNLEYKSILPQDFHPSSKVWVYQCSRLLSLWEALQSEPMLKDFVSQWKTHGTPVKGYANLFFGQFIILMADETASMVSGCSTDSSVHLIKNIEQAFGVEMFNRQSLAFIVKERIQLLPLPQLDYALKNNFITPDTLYFNNLVATKTELENNWIIPLQNSWLKAKIKTSFAEN